MSEAMKTVISTEFRDLIEETFSKVAGHYLDRGTSLIETLGPLSAERVSRPHPANGETVAGHVFHLVFYLDVVDEYARGVRTGKTNWDESWVVKQVDDEAWAVLLDRLRQVEIKLKASSVNWEWSDAERFGGMVSMLMHTAFHLAAIRQILDTTA